MNDKFEIIKPNIFDKEKIISGVTCKNLHLFPETGFSISAGKIFNENELISHRKYFAEFLNIPIKNLKCQKQVHGTYVRILDKNSLELESDGMMTTEKGLILCVATADCCAILIHDPVNNAIAALHSGWKGTKENMAKVGIDKMIESYYSSPEDLLIYLSPCASGEKYEVGWDVAKYFPNSIKKLPNGKYLFDNYMEITKQLIDCGVNPENIESASECTISNNNLHSFRRDKDKAGRMAAYIGLS
jgi:polyphenol oxidase